MWTQLHGCGAILTTRPSYSFPDAERFSLHNHLFITNAGRLSLHRHLLVFRRGAILAAQPSIHSFTNAERLSPHNHLWFSDAERFSCRCVLSSNSSCGHQWTSGALWSSRWDAPRRNFDWYKNDSCIAMYIKQRTVPLETVPCHANCTKTRFVLTAQRWRSTMHAQANAAPIAKCDDNGCFVSMERFLTVQCRTLFGCCFAARSGSEPMNSSEKSCESWNP